jgi:hypothetical protein
MNQYIAYKLFRLNLVLSLFLLLSAAGAVFGDVQLPNPLRTWISPGHTKYYVDSVGGNDTNNGTSPDHAWQSLTMVNSGIFAPGDWIYLKSGSHWDNFFCPGGSGADKHPIKVASYGVGPMPSVDAHGKTLATVSIQNGEYWDVEDMDVTNTSDGTIPYLRGVEVNLVDFGTAHDISLQNLYVHDTASPEDKYNGGSGIFCDNRGDKIKSNFDGLLIQNCHLVHTDRNGITMDSGYWDRTKWFPSLNVVIRGNLLENIGGDCIVAIGCDSPLLERNTVHGGRIRASDWASGIWVWSCDNAVIQYNEIDGMHGQEDAQGFDSDWNCRNTLIQYNYSHDNEGGFVMVVDNGGVHLPIDDGNSGAIIRYNISQNDNFRTFTLSGPISDVQIYNNDIYIGKNITTDMFFAWNWGGTWGDNVKLSNNIFYILGNANLNQGGVTNVVYTNNDIFGKLNGTPAGSGNLSVDPLFQSPGTATSDPSTLAGYQLDKKSPCYNAGIPIPDNGDRNYWQKNLKGGNSANIGAE